MGGTNMLSKAIKWVKQTTDSSSESSHQIAVVDAFLRHPFYCSLGEMKRASFINVKFSNNLMIIFWRLSFKLLIATGLLRLLKQQWYRVSYAFYYKFLFLFLPAFLLW